MGVEMMLPRTRAAAAWAKVRVEFWSMAPAAAKPDENSAITEKTIKAAASIGRKKSGRWLAEKSSIISKKPRSAARVIR